MRRSKLRPDLQSGINVTPLVDVVLVLLIIFMVIAPELRVEAEVELPRTDGPPAKPDGADPIVVTLAPGGDLRVEEISASLDSLSETLRRAAVNRPEPDVVLKADARLTFGEVRRAMIAIEAAGFKNVGLIAQPSRNG